MVEIAFFLEKSMRKYKNLCSFYNLNNIKIMIAKEDFHQLTQCCDNSLFI